MPIPSANRPPEQGLLVFAGHALQRRGHAPDPDLYAEPVPADGSQRVFFRIRSRAASRSWIAVENPPTTPFFRRENLAYLHIGRHLRGRGAPVPEMLSWDLERGWFLLEDLGEVRLHDGWDDLDDPLGRAEAVLSALFHMQVHGVRGFDPAWCCQTRRYGRALMRRYESNYFRDAFLREFLGLDRSWAFLEGPFEHLAASASRAGARFFLHRDFQSRNILIRDQGPGFVDWQGGRLGPLGYDLASFLIDPYLGLSKAARDRLYRFYLGLLRDHDPSSTGRFEETFPYLALQRNLQILGAFAFLSRVRGKPFFQAFVPPAAGSLLDRLETLGDPQLRPLHQVVEDARDRWEIR